MCNSPRSLSTPAKIERPLLQSSLTQTPTDCLHFINRLGARCRNGRQQRLHERPSTGEIRPPPPAHRIGQRLRSTGPWPAPLRREEHRSPLRRDALVEMKISRQGLPNRAGVSLEAPVEGE